MASYGLYEDDGSMRVTLTGGAGTPLAAGQGSTTSGQSGILIQGAVTTASPTYTTGQTSPISLTTGGNVRTALFSNTGASIASGAGASSAGIRVAVATDANIGVSPYPWSATAGTTATPINAFSGNVAAGSAVATLAGVASKTTYISGFQITASGATAALVVDATVTGLVSGTATYTFTFPAGVTVGATPLVVLFDPPVPASAANTAIVVTLPSGGAGAAHAAVNAQGFQL